ncbi:MAG: glycosyltransferase family 2 protein [Proteobacteria bacterium]|nr:glycosyltransferase family 2 protein [Pseudomonadota bacterium]
MKKLTVIIPVKNEEHHIEAALQSVAFADEIMVVDSFSTDRTVELAKKYTDFILQREYDYPASQKNWAIPRASHEWILLLDADERISPELQAEICSILNQDTDKSAFWIYRRNHFMGKPVRFSGWQNDRVIRLIKRDECRYEDKLVHEEIVTQGEVGRLKNPMLHFTYTNLKAYLAKMDRYTTWSALEKNKKTKSVTFFHLGIKPCYRFFTHYILRLGILDGQVGFIISALSAYSIFLRYLKMLRLKEKESL